MITQKRILFLCTGNSCRSQMAEALLRHLLGDEVVTASAGTEPKRLHPLAVRVMEEIGLDISHQRSKGVDNVMGHSWDLVITVCDRAKESCPLFPGDSEKLHWSFDDPAEAQGSDEQRVHVFRRVRDEILTRLRHFVLSKKLERKNQEIQ
ncbi:MAG: arsenate reductase ArsC [Thermoanaerobaculia bacterium]